MKKTLICSFLIIILFLSACAAPETVERTTSTTDSTPSSTVTKTTTKSTSTQTMSQEVKDILNKHKTIESQQYIRDNGFDTTRVFLKGDKYIITVKPPSRSDPSTNYDSVFIDRSEKTASGYCFTDKPTDCPIEHRDKAYAVDYDTYKEDIFPLDLLKNIDYAEKTGSATIDGRKNTILELTNQDGNRERVWIDNYFGFIMKQEIYDSNDEVIEKHTFTGISINKLKDRDVNLPEGVEIVE